MASQTRRLPAPRVRAKPMPKMSPDSVCSRVSARQYWGSVWTASLPAPSGREKRRSSVETRWITHEATGSPFHSFDMTDGCSFQQK